ncbi:MAG: RNA methyltransferase [Clostridia bacterium]|nr:RNA methyltransferase [Clostridia bacterium]
MENITSKNNEKIKSAVAVRDSASQRKKSGKFFVEGARLCGDAAISGGDILQFFFTEKAKDKFSDFYKKIISVAEESYCISDDVSRKLSDTQSPQGMFCVCRIDDKNLSADKINPYGKYILLENVQDPSNLGAVARTAEAMGIDGLIVNGGCDIYNPKALRACMGAFFRLNIIESDDILPFIKSVQGNGIKVFASTPDGQAEKITQVNFSGGVICIVGNEGNGVTPETMAAADAKITIPMQGRAESLNASTAAAILIWEMVRRGS